MLYEVITLISWSEARRVTASEKWFQKSTHIKYTRNFKNVDPDFLNQYLNEIYSERHDEETVQNLFTQILNRWRRL